MNVAFSPHNELAARALLSNWRLTPATMLHRLSNGLWIPAPWLQYTAARVAAGIHRGGARIIISAPPRHGKTKLIAIGTSAWVLETLPRRNVILTGYGSDLVEASARETRKMFWENDDLLRVKIPRDTSRWDQFQTDHDGYMFSVGLGGAITGRGAHVLIIDDYIKEIKEALSPTHRDYLWNWFVTTAMTRLEPGASVIIIATRWHSDDLIGRILKNFPDKWENICLPALALENDILGRQVGEPLFPQRFGVADLEAQRELLGSIFFHALYQQGPVDEVLKIANSAWLKITKKVPVAPDWKWIRCWDLAATEGGGDYLTGVLQGFSKSLNMTIIANVVREQFGPAKTEELIQNTAHADGLDATVGIEQEPGASAKNLVNHYKVNVLPEYRVVAVPTSGKAKIVRAQPFLAAAEAGHVYLLDENYDEQQGVTRAPWIPAFCKEFNDGFAGINDDQTDMAAAGFNHNTGKKPISTAWARRIPRNTSPNSRAIRRASFMHATRPGRLTFGR